MNALDPFGADFADLHSVAARIRVERAVTALLSFVVWLRLFKYTRRVPVFGTIGRTIMRAFPAVRAARLNFAPPCSVLDRVSHAYCLPAT